MDSILTSIKKILGIEEEYEQFDQDIIMHINTVLGILLQLGVGPKEGFVIYDKTQTWSDYISDAADLNMVKTYIALKVRLIFDPPQHSAVVEVMNRQISELEWRLNVQAEHGGESNE